MTIAVFGLHVLFVRLPEPDCLKSMMVFGKSVKNNPKLLL